MCLVRDEIMPFVCSTTTPRVSSKWYSNWITEIIEGVHRIELEGTFTGAIAEQDGDHLRGRKAKYRLMVET